MGLTSVSPVADKPGGEELLPFDAKNSYRNLVKAEKSKSSGKAASADDDTMELSGAKLGMRVASDVMGWTLDHDEYTDSWVDAGGKLTGYYYGRPFSPYRDRNALKEVWDRIETLGLRNVYLAELNRLLGVDEGASENIVAWALHTSKPEIACRAALLAVRGKGEA